MLLVSYGVVLSIMSASSTCPVCGVYIKIKELDTHVSQCVLTFSKQCSQCHISFSLLSDYRKHDCVARNRQHVKKKSSTSSAWGGYSCHTLSNNTRNKFGGRGGRGAGRGAARLTGPLSGASYKATPIPRPRNTRNTKQTSIRGAWGKQQTSKQKPPLCANLATHASQEIQSSTSACPICGEMILDEMLPVHCNECFLSHSERDLNNNNDNNNNLRTKKKSEDNENSKNNQITHQLNNKNN